MQAQGEIESLITSICFQEKKRRLFAWGIKGILFISISAPCAALSKWYPSWTTMLSAPALIATGFYLWRSKYESLTVSRLQAAQILDEMLHVKERVSAFAAISESSEASDIARCAFISEQIQEHLRITPIHPRSRPELTLNQRNILALSIVSLALTLALYLFRPISPLEKLAQAVESVLEAHPELPQEVAIMAQQSVEDLRSSDLLAAQESLAQTRDAVAQALADLKNGDSADERTVGSDSFNADAPARPSKEIAAISSPTPTPAGIEGEQSEKEQQGSGGDKKDENQGDKQSQRGQGQSKQSGSNGAGDKRTEGSSGSGKQQEQDSDGGDGDGDGSGKGASKQQGDKSQSGDGSGGSGGQNGGHDQQKDRRGERSKEGQSKDGQNGESGDGSNPNSRALEKLKDAVDQASQQLNQQKDQGAQQSQKGEQQQEGKQAGQGQQSDQGSQNQQGAKGSQGQQGKESDKSQGAGQSENNAEGSSSSNGEQNNNRSDRNENGKEEGKEKGKQGSKEANNKAKDPGSSGQGSSSQKEQNKERKPQQEDGDIDSTGDRSSMPDRSAQPTDQDPSSGTGSGGTETANSPAKEAKIEGSDERFDARFTGASGELEKSKKDAQAKTTLKDIILAKPKGSTHKGDQPIPLEYRGILGD